MGRRLRVWRAWHGYTQAEAAALIRVGDSTYQRWESRPGTIPFREWQWLNQYLEEHMPALASGARLVGEVG